jgi:hypothetical protein
MVAALATGLLAWRGRQTGWQFFGHFPYVMIALSVLVFAALCRVCMSPRPARVSKVSCFRAASGPAFSMMMFAVIAGFGISYAMRDLVLYPTSILSRVVGGDVSGEASRLRFDSRFWNAVTEVSDVDAVFIVPEELQLEVVVAAERRILVFDPLVAKYPEDNEVREVLEGRQVYAGNILNGVCGGELGESKVNLKLFLLQEITDRQELYCGRQVRLIRSAHDVVFRLAEL